MLTDNASDDNERLGGPPSHAVSKAVLGITLALVLAALAVSVALLVYTARHHDLKNGLFAIIFATLTTQVALNWFRWKDEDSKAK